MGGKRRDAARKPSATAVEAHTITYPISPDFWKKWGVTDALREVIANALDEDSEPLVAWQDGVLVVEDQGPGIGEEGLILGVSNKGSKQIGQWGEGLKGGCAVLAAKQNIGRVLVETVGYTLEPKLAEGSILKALGNGSGSGKHKLLAYTVTPNERRRGTRVTVACSKAEADKAIALFRHLADPSYQPPPAPGAIVEDAPGKIFIGGLFVQERKGLRFGYDLSLKSWKNKQNRDRTVIDGHELERAIQEILLEVADPDVLEVLVRAALDGKLQKAERAFNTYGADPGYRKAMKAVAKRILGEGPVCYQAKSWGANEDHEAEAVLDLKDRGYRVLEAAIDYHEFVQLMRLLGVRSAGELYKKPKLRKNDKRKTDWVDLDKLSDDERRVLERAVATVRALYGQQAVDGYGVYSRTALEMADTELHWGGFYQPQSGKIGLHRDNLASFEATLEVLIHEAGHRLRHRERRYDYGDRTRGFESQLVKMAMLAAARLSEAGLLPTTLAELESAEAEKPQDPSALACALVRERMQATGLKTYAKLSEESGVTPHVAQTVAKGEGHGYRMSPKPKNVRAVCEALGLDWLPIWLAVSGTNLFMTYSRRKNGWLYGRGYPEAMEAVHELRARGQEELATLVEAHAQGTEPTAKDDLSWQSPYRELVEVEAARVAAA